MAWGLFKKVVIADRLAIYVNQIYGAPSEYHGLTLLVATVFFAFQIYCDFSGYSDIAIGSAQAMGFTLMQNFNRPYFSRSISEFWKRWHISLSTWFRDYLYIPLGGNRVSRLRLHINIFITFLISGLWHGANWTFVVWGSLNGLYMIVGFATSGIRQALSRKLGLLRVKWLHTAIRVTITFSLVCVAWVFFRAGTIADAFTILHRIVSDSIRVLNGEPYSPLQELRRILPTSHLVTAIASIGLLVTIQLIQIRLGSVRNLLAAMPVTIRWSVYYAYIVIILSCSVIDNTQFIYFQF
jgi:alginate O-acetyltransferase complex protein AlgI